MTLRKLLDQVTNKNNFVGLQGFVDFGKQYLAYIGSNLQAVIVARNEHHYRFYQYDAAADYQITRPINSYLMYDAQSFEFAAADFVRVLKNIRDIDKNDAALRTMLNKCAYTMQQSIGAALDALPAGKSNTARKLNGDLFERFVRILITEIGLECKSGTVRVPVRIDGQKQFDVVYQHDLIIEKDGEPKVLGSVKTSSKDRIDKIFVDKFLYNKLTGSNIPHIAIFLNDVQRKNTKKVDEYSVAATFLPGHFKGYTVRLNPLDGVYYCDIRPTMTTDTLLKEHIKTFDRLLIEDIWSFM